MRTRELKVTRIGNSRGVRLPAESLKRYRIGDAVIMEEKPEGLLLRPAGPVSEKLSWEDTAGQMAAAGEDWSEWNNVSADGLDSIPWKPEGVRAVAESKASYGSASRKAKRS